MHAASWSLCLSVETLSCAVSPTTLRQPVLKAAPSASSARYRDSCEIVEARQPRMGIAVLAVEDGLLEVVLLDQLLEQPLSLDLRLLAEIPAVQPEQIEGEVDQPILIAFAEISLQLGEVRSPLMDDDDLASTMACPSTSKAPAILENLLTQL
jgi:hypothetical protein